MKYERQAKILELIENSDIETQDDLTILLKDNGFDVTQATVSRDIKELKLVKAGTLEGKTKYTTLLEKQEVLPGKMMSVFNHAYISSDYANNIIVVKTLSGMAQAVASVIDFLKLDAVLGTIAGDDNILIVCRAEKYAEEIVSIFNRMLG